MITGSDKRILTNIHQTPQGIQRFILPKALPSTFPPIYITHLHKLFNESKRTNKTDMRGDLGSPRTNKIFCNKLVTSDYYH